MATKIPGVYVDFKGDLTQLKQDFRQAKAEAQKAGTDISNALGNAVMPNTVTSSFDKLYKGLTKVNKAAGLTQQDFKGVGVTLSKDLLKNVHLSEKAFADLHRRMLQNKATAQAERALKSVAKEAGLAASQVAVLKLKMGDTAGAFRDFGKIGTSAFAKLRKALFSLKSAMAALGIGYFGQQIFDVGRNIAQTEKAFVEITGSAADMRAEFAFLRDVADQMGQNFYALLNPYKQLMAASRNTALEGKAMRDVFTGIVKAAATLGLTSEQVNGALNAVQQMISKGNVQAEELRGQLGERIPGAFNLAAEAMGVTTQELNKMLEQGEVLAVDLLPRLGDVLSQKYSGEVDKATEASNKWAEAWTDLKAAMAGSGFLTSISEAMTEISDTFRDDEFKQAMADFAKNIGEIAKAMAGIAKYAGLRSITGTFGKGVELAAQGKLDWEKFRTASFLERQRMVDAVFDNAYLADPGGGYDAGETSSAERSLSKPAPTPTATYTEAELNAFIKSAEGVMGNWERMLADRQLINSRTLDAMLADEKAYVEAGNATAKDFWLIQHEDRLDVQARTLEAMTQAEEEANEGLIRLSERTADAMEDNFSNLFFDAFQGKLDSLSDYWDSIWQSMTRAAADYLGQLVKEFMFGEKAGGSGWLNSIGQAIGGFLGSGNSMNTGAPTHLGAGGTTAFQMAGGGYIGEDISGMGKATGQSYEFHANEFILPAERLGNTGKAAGGNLHVIINNHTPAGINVQEKQRADGDRLLYVAVANNIASGGPVSKAFEARYGLMPQGRRV